MLVIPQRILKRYVSGGSNGGISHFCKTAQRLDSGIEAISLQAKA